MTCSECNLTYIEDDPRDRREHAARHRRWGRATAALGYRPAGYREREVAKSDGRARLEVASTDQERVEAAEQILRGRFDRSLEVALDGGYWRKHPTLERYIAMIIRPADIDPATWRLLRQRYGRELDEIAPGYSYWFPAGKDRESQWTEHRRRVRRGEAESQESAE